MLPFIPLKYIENIQANATLSCIIIEDIKTVSLNLREKGKFKLYFSEQQHLLYVAGFLHETWCISIEQWSCLSSPRPSRKSLILTGINSARLADERLRV
jgi:hypothetical protein